MSLNIALQSVVFYVLSCSTCAKFNHRQRIKTQAKRERAEKDASQAKNPELYRHPSPFSTNQYWSEDILMGPRLARKNDRGWPKNRAHQIPEVDDKTSSYAESISKNSETPSTPTVMAEFSRISLEGWNIQRYQREDELLWGDHELPSTVPRTHKTRTQNTPRPDQLSESDVYMIGLTKKNGVESPTPNYHIRNPPVNDLHPPIVSMSPLSIGETRWMIQPPPNAKLMEGKEIVYQSRSSSRNSFPRVGGETTTLNR
ncbi:Bgt-3684 [Blumeria graminis f. sp. tritici]|uniref:Bgt-3684 n=2 Tax=Blumeria graminis f. sp. tritici TaxID=62690 RepID=A0A061HMY3_BLUGR|nr:hypothetical protein BGT96224_3684 [Blumeria graminis f. sp. tritici 96224]VDB92663.1 Bgt-3684 [Blumeria graminis f. sp. tritici]